MLVLGGGLTPDGGVPPWCEGRLELARRLWEADAKARAAARAGAEEPSDAEASSARPSASCSVVLLGGGTPNRQPHLTPHGFVWHESAAYARGLEALGLPSRCLLRENSSYDTVGNAYFSAAIHALPAGWTRLAVVTGAVHMPRSRAVFEKVYALAGAAARRRFRLRFCESEDAGTLGASRAALEARRRKEERALERWRRDAEALDTFAQLHAWLHASHLCYAVARQDEMARGNVLDPVLSATY